MRLAMVMLSAAVGAAPALAQPAAPGTSPQPATVARPMNSSERVQALIGQLIIQTEQQRDQIEALTRELSEARADIARLKEEPGKSKPK
jgi:Spy/CpxP family protein refolding chaperone